MRPMPLNPSLPMDARELERMYRAARAGLERGVREDNRPLARNCRFLIRELRNQLHLVRAGAAHA